MPVYWTFRLEHVARRVLYLDAMKATDSYGDASGVIAAFRQKLDRIRPWQDMMA